jgi:D-alanyl-D-alanine carboxypeptidase
MLQKSFCTLLALTSAIALFSAEDPGARKIQEILTTAIKESSAPGFAAAVLKNDQIISAAAGVKILGKDDPVLPSSRFHIGSVTKPMTATVIATVVESGKLSWTTKLIDIFPEWKEQINPEFQQITLEDLLAHQAGIQPFTDDEEFKNAPKAAGTPIEIRRTFALFALQQKPAVKPQKEYSYSNAGFTIATAMAEKVTGESWEKMIKERIFEPLGMTTAGFGWPAKAHPDEPWGHWIQNGKLQPHDPNGEYQLPASIAPAGDVHVSMQDLAKFARAHLQALHGKQTILKPETAHEMHRKRIKSGLGWGIQELLGHDPVSVYAGSAETMNTLIALLHKENVAVMVSANAESEQIENATKQAFKSLIQTFAPVKNQEGK